MGTSAHVIVVGAPVLVDIAVGRLADLEQRWSRFLESSEVSRLNRAAGGRRRVSVETALLVRRALEGHRATAGLFDPTQLGDLLRAGYTESFERLGEHPAGRAGPWHTGADDIEVDGRSVYLPAGVAFDPGGIGKGLAADIVTGELIELGARGACVNVGGDLRVRGAAPDGGGWRVAIDDDGDPGAGSSSRPTVVLEDGAVATSSRLRRRWVGADGVAHHHLLDPRAPGVVATAARSATVIAADGWRAEALAKALFLDPDQGIGLIDRLGAAGRVVCDDGAVSSARWPAWSAPDTAARA